MQKYCGNTYTQDVIPRITDHVSGYTVDDQGFVNTQLFLRYKEGCPSSIDYFWEFICGWNNINTICIHDTRDVATSCNLTGLDGFRKKLSTIRSHLRHSIKLCGGVGAMEYTRRIADIGDPSTAHLAFHRDRRGGCTWLISDCRNKSRYYRTSSEKILPFLENMVIALDRDLRTLDTYRRYVNKDIRRHEDKLSDMVDPK